MKRYFRLSFIVLALTVNASLVHSAPCSGSNAITKVENKKRGTFEFVNFYIMNANPDYTVTSVQGPSFTDDPSGKVVKVSGNKWTQVRFRRINWVCTITKNFSTPEPIIKQVENIEQSEGQVTYVIGRLNKHYLGNSLTTIVGGKMLSLKYH